MCDIVDLEEALTKTGEALFKELFRIYPVAEPEDYIKNGQWRNELIKSDLVLMESHRREAGAPDPPDAEDIKFPPMPNAYGGATSTMTLASKLSQMSTGQAVPAGPAGGAAVEIRLMALFVAKWKLEPTTAKGLLSKLPSARRRYVIQNFKATASGAEGTAELETFIQECEKEGAWDTATTGTAPTILSAAGSTPPAGGLVKPTLTIPRPAGAAPTLVAVKRPLGAVQTGAPAWAANKKPTGPAGIRPLLTPSVVSPKAVAPKAVAPKSVAPKAVGPKAVAPKLGGPAKAGGPALVKPPAKAGGKLITGLLSNF